MRFILIALCVAMFCGCVTTKSKKHTASVNVVVRDIDVTRCDNGTAEVRSSYSVSW